MNGHRTRCREAPGGLAGPTVPVWETEALHQENDAHLLLALEKG